jgi:hypothetical protein
MYIGNEAMLDMKKLFILVAIVFFAVNLYAQDDSFGFGFDDDESVTSSSASFSLPFSVNISGEARLTVTGYVDDFDKAKKVRLGNIFSGKLNFEATSDLADAIINVNVDPEFERAYWKNPFSIDEAYGRFYFGRVTFEGGIRKLTWGKADSLGPLDVVNPIDYSDLSKMSDLAAIKIARPLLHLTFNAGDWTKIEGVFVPWFSGNYYETDINNRWVISEIKGVPEKIADGIVEKYPSLAPNKSKYESQVKTLIENGALQGLYPKMESVEYFQGGLRGSTTMGSSDIGLQYYYGRLFRPAISGIAPVLPPPYTTIDSIDAKIDYNRFHQIGLDWAQVIAGFNARAEFAGNITKDLKGANGSVYNPFLSWSLGFDRDLFLGINLNLQASETIRLMHSRINDNPALDTEAGKSVTSTRITSVLSKKILQDRIEFKINTIWGVEDNDCYIMPGIVWTREAVNAELSTGIFAGDRGGELGQYRDNNYLKALVTYQF